MSSRESPQAAGSENTAFQGGPLPRAVYEKSLDCVHCGLCLSACPTYLATGRESSSPRGRIYLMRGVAEGRVAAGQVLAEESYLCLGCRACETACPSGVEYGAILELTRAAVDDAGLRPGLARRVERLALRGVVPHRGRLRLLVSLLGLAQRMGLDRLALSLLPRAWSGLRDAHGLMPAVPPTADRRSLPPFVPAEGERRGRVAFFAGCIMPEIFGGVNRATVRLLALNGYDVVVPPTQGCCGALQAHGGDLEYARGLARANARVFGALDVDALIVNSAGCGAAMREAEHWIGAEGRAYAAKVRDITEFLDEVGLRTHVAAPASPASPASAGSAGFGTRPTELRVCYDDPCHLVHGQGVRAAPRRLLAQVPGVKMVDHADPDACCGAAGIYNLTHGEMSRTVLARKLDALQEARPDVIATGNPGCMMQLRAGVRERGISAEVMHPVELLLRAVGGGQR